MSARSIIVLALVALVTIHQANSLSYKGGQSYYQEPLKGDFVMPQQQQLRQPVYAESYKSAPVVAAQPAQQVETVAVSAAPVQQAAQTTYEAPAKGGQSFYQEPFKGSYVQQHQQPLLQSRPVVQQPAQQVESYAVSSAPVQQAAQTTYEAPVKGGQSFYQHRQPMYAESWKSAPVVAAQPAQQVETVAVSAAPVQQAAQATYEAPAKGGQSFYQEPFKGSYVQQRQQPLLQSRPVVQQPAQQVESYAVSSAPLQQAAQTTFEAPVKRGQSFYQLRQPMYAEMGHKN